MCVGMVLLRREDGHVLKREFEDEGQGKKGRLKRTWKKRVVKGCMKV